MKTNDYIVLGVLGAGAYFLFKKGFFDDLFKSTPMLNRESTDLMTQMPQLEGEQGIRTPSTLSRGEQSLITVPSYEGQTTTYKLPKSSTLSSREQKAIGSGSYYIDVTKNTISTNPLIVGLSKTRDNFIKSNSSSYSQSTLTPTKMVSTQGSTTYKGSSNQIALQTAINKTSSTLKSVGSSALKTAATAVTSTASLFSKAATAAISKAKSLKSSKKK